MTRTIEKEQRVGTLTQDGEARPNGNLRKVQRAIAAAALLLTFSAASGAQTVVWEATLIVEESGN